MLLSKNMKLLKKNFTSLELVEDTLYGAWQILKYINNEISDETGTARTRPSKKLPTAKKSAGRKSAAYNASLDIDPVLSAEPTAKKKIPAKKKAAPSRRRSS